MAIVTPQLNVMQRHTNVNSLPMIGIHKHPRNKGKCFATTSIYKFIFFSANHLQAMQASTN
jgi:hypothetical protein